MEMERWVCPNDRQLALRAKLGTGWSVHTNKYSSFSRGDHLSVAEQDQIMKVIKKAEKLDIVEMERIGRLVERVDNMKNSAMGDGVNQCILCADEFTILRASPTHCDHCRKAVCSKCGVDTINSHHQQLWLCKICSENRELWKRSGAWFFKGIPKYIIPCKKTDSGRTRVQKYQTTAASSPVSAGGMTYNTWSRAGRRSLSDSSESDSSEDLDHKVSIGAKKRTFESVESRPTSIDSSRVNQPYLPSGDQGQVSATESSREDYHEDLSDNDSIGRFSRENSIRSTTESSHEQHMHTSDSKSCDTAISNTRRDITPPHTPDSANQNKSLGMLEFNVCYDSLNKTLTCNINKAMNLKAMDSNGLSDPYVKVHLLPGFSKALKLRTKTIHKTLNPEWYEALVFEGVFEEDMMTKTLRLSVLDEDTFGYDFIGEYRVPLKSIKPHFTKPFYVELEKRIREADDELTSDERGRILLSLRYSVQRKQLSVTVVRCVGLAAMDSNGYSDPYVKLYLKPDKDKKTKHKTKVKKKTLNPEFNEEFVYNVAQNELFEKTLEISVWDKDLGHNELIGGVEFCKQSRGDRLKHWFQVIKQTNETHTMWHKLDLSVVPSSEEKSAASSKKKKSKSKR